MSTQSEFLPFTENTAIGYPTKQSSDIASSLSLKIYQPVSSISLSVEPYPSNYALVSRLGHRIVAHRQINDPQTIPQTSPLYSLQFLKKGWDGYWAEPLSQEILVRAHQLWWQINRLIDNKTTMPVVRPAANGSVALTWSCEYPEKELEIWLYDQSDYYAEWMLSVNDLDKEGTARSQADLLRLIREYQES